MKENPKKIKIDRDASEINVITTGEKYNPIPSGIYKALLKKVETGWGAYGQPVFIFTFSIEAGPFLGRPINLLINQSSNGVNGKLFQLVRALKNIEFKENQQLALGKLIGASCYINVEQNGVKNAISELISIEEYERLKPSAA